jgi:hypothetical protein
MPEPYLTITRFSALPVGRVVSADSAVRLVAGCAVWTDKIAINDFLRRILTIHLKYIIIFMQMIGNEVRSS